MGTTGNRVTGQLVRGFESPSLRLSVARKPRSCPSGPGLFAFRDATPRGLPEPKNSRRTGDPEYDAEPQCCRDPVPRGSRLTYLQSAKLAQHLLGVDILTRRQAW